MTTVVVTGANRGIGLEFVRQYAEDRVNVIACCRVPDRADLLNTLTRNAGSKVDVRPLDVADASAIFALGKALADEPVDILINNAGYYGPKEQSADRMDFSGWAYTFAVNTMAPLAMAQALHPNLKAGVQKKIVSLTGGMGSTGENGGGSLAYRASKAALNNVMRSLSVDWRGEGIIAVPIDPGWVKTDMGGENAPLTVEESVGAMRRVIAKLTLADSGQYLKWNGQERPW